MKIVDHYSVTAAAFDIMRSIHDDLPILPAQAAIVLAAKDTANRNYFEIVATEESFVVDRPCREALDNPHTHKPSQAESSGMRRVICSPDSCSTMHIREKT